MGEGEGGSGTSSQKKKKSVRGERGGAAALTKMTLSPKKKKTRTILCFYACPGVVLDIREGQPRPPSDGHFLVEGSPPRLYAT